MLSSIMQSVNMLNVTYKPLVLNTAVHYSHNFNPTFSMVKMTQYITAILG